MTSKSRTYCFTLNNYTESDIDYYQQLVNTGNAKYIIIGKEVGAEGTPHLQGFVSFASPRSFNAIKDLLPRAHLEKANTLSAAIEYCKKDGDFIEWGDAPKTQKEKGAGEKRRWADAINACKEGRFDDVDPDIYLRYDQNCQRIRDRVIRARVLPDTEEKHEWYYGGTGTGKSRKARTENPGAYLKMCNKWWDGYVDQEVVLIEDFDKKHDVLCHHLKIWADRYPFPAEAKGRAMVIRPRKLIVTSNYHPDEIWTSPSDLEPILRRFHITHFN